MCILMVILMGVYCYAENPVILERLVGLGNGLLRSAGAEDGGGDDPAQRLSIDPS